jgi:hypothetical protein
MQDAPKLTCVSWFLSLETLVSRNFKLQLRQGGDDDYCWAKEDALMVPFWHRFCYVAHGFFDCLRLFLGYIL